MQQTKKANSGFNPLDAFVMLCGDCLEIMPTIPDKSIDLILVDLPYGVTSNKWDSIINIDELWIEYNRIIKDVGAIVLTAVNPFAANLIMSNPKMYKHEWVWEKNAGSNFGAVRFQPMREHELVLVFGKKIKYFPIKEERAENGKSRVKYTVNYNTKTENYHDTLHNKVSSNRPNMRYPRSIQKFNRERGLHPTQKPVELMEYLIKTYTDDGDTVLDNAMGSGTTGVACKNLNRRFIGIEKDEKYFEVAKQRIEAT